MRSLDVVRKKGQKEELDRLLHLALHAAQMCRTIDATAYIEEGYVFVYLRLSGGRSFRRRVPICLYTISETREWMELEFRKVAGPAR